MQQFTNNFESHSLRLYNTSMRRIQQYCFSVLHTIPTCKKYHKYRPFTSNLHFRAVHGVIIKEDVRRDLKICRLQPSVIG